MVIKMNNYKYKQVIIVRGDLKISKGKLAVQVAHAAVTAFYESIKHKKKIVVEWLRNHQPKIVLKARSEPELIEIYNKAIGEGLVAVLIKDAGLTELPPGTTTCVGIGPDKVELINPVTGDLPLL